MEGLYHVWFSTKGRKQAFDGELGDEVSQLFTDMARDTGIRLLEMEMAADHVHILVELSGTQTLSSTIHQLKGASARSLFLRHPDLRTDMSHNSFWQKGYGWRKIDLADEPGVRNYIRTQRNRPLRHDD